MLGYVRLCGFEEVLDVIHTSFAAQQYFHDVKADGVGQGLENLGFLF
jgi:hypothetical protein